jgi:hypothetical protein
VRVKISDLGRGALACASGNVTTCAVQLYLHHVGCSRPVPSSAVATVECTVKSRKVVGAAFVILFGCSGAVAEPCVITNRQIYNLVADTVHWSMRVGNGHTCFHGIRFAKVQFEKMTLVSSPRSGQVVLHGSAFTYVPKKNFEGDDSFDLDVAGQIQKVRGASTIHVVVSVESEQPHVAKTSVPKPAPPPAGPVSGVASSTSLEPRTAQPKAPGTTPNPPAPGLMPGLGSGIAPVPLAVQPGAPVPTPNPPRPGALPVPVPRFGSGPVPSPLPTNLGAPVPIPTAVPSGPSTPL